MLAIVGTWLFLRQRGAALGFAAGAAAVLAGLLAISRVTWGTWLPPYYAASRIARLPSLEGLAGVLVSPSRGLLVFVPALVLLLAAGLFRYRSLERRDLYALGAAGLALQTLVLASYPQWWGGHGYGPRLYTEAVFFMALVAFAVVPALRRGAPASDRRSRRTLAALVVVGVGLHAAGAWSTRAAEWNIAPASVDEARERLWDWRDPQFLAWTQRRPQPATDPGAPSGQPAREGPSRLRQSD